MQSNEGSKSSSYTRTLFGNESSRHSSHNMNSKKHTHSVESTNLPPPPPPPPRYPLKNDGFSLRTGYVVSGTPTEKTPKSPPRTSSLRPRGIPLKREIGSHDLLQPVTYGSAECQILKKPQIITSCSNNANSEKQFPHVDRPVRPFNLSNDNNITTTTSTAVTTTTATSFNNHEKSLKTIEMNKNKVDSLCHADLRSTPLLSRLLAPGFATSVVSSTNSPPSSIQRKGSDQSYTSSENDRSSGLLSSSNPQVLLSETKRQGIEFGLTNSSKFSKKSHETSSWNSPSSSTNVQSINCDWRESINWCNKSETPIVQSNKNQSPNFQPSPDSQCWRTMTSIQRKNDNILPRQSSSNTCSSATQDEMESSIDSPGIFNRGRCDVESNDQNKIYEKSGDFSTNASSSGDADDVHEEQERRRQQQQDNEHCHHHQSNENKHLPFNYTNSGQKITPQLVLPHSSQEPCGFEEDCPDYSNQMIQEIGDINSQNIIQSPPPPPPPPPPYKIPDHLQPTDDSSFFMNNPWVPSNYHLYPYSQLPHHPPHLLHNHFHQDKLFPINSQYDAKRFVPNPIVLPKSPVWPVFENPNNLLYMKQNNYPPESLSMPYPGGLISKRAICSQNKEEFSRIMKNDLTSTTINNLPVSATAFVLTTTTSHICSLAYEYNAYNRNNNQPLIMNNYQSELPLGSGPVIRQFTEPELFPSSMKSESIHQNTTQMDFTSLLKENQQLKQRLIDINARLQYVDELEWHVQQLSHLVESMILSHQRQCELDYQLQIYSPLSAPVCGVGGGDFHRFKIPPNSSSSSSSPFGLNNDQCSTHHFHNMPANPGSLPVMPTNMSSCRTHPCTAQNITRRVTQPNIMSTRFYGPCVKQTMQPEKIEQRIPMLNSTKRSLHPHLVGSMDPRTVSLDRASQPRNSCTTFPIMECNCIRCPLHETFALPHSKEHAYVNTITKDGVFSTPNVSMIIPNSPCFSPNYRRRRCTMRATTAQFPPSFDNESHLLPHSNVPPLCCSPPPRLPLPVSTSIFTSNKPLSNPTIKITDENKVANLSLKHGNSVSRDSTQPSANITNAKHNKNRPTGLNFMTEKSEILDDSQMLLKHLSPNNEFQCVNGCTVVVTTTCQLTHCYPLCIMDRTLPLNETNSHHNENQTDIGVIITNNNDDNNTSTIVTLTSTTIMTTTSTTTCTSPRSTASSSHENKMSDNQDADYSGSYEGVSNSNSSHSQSSGASSLEPDSTLSENSNSISSTSMHTCSNSPVCTVNSCNIVLSDVRLSSPLQVPSSSNSINSNINIPNVHVNTATSFTPCHSANLNSITLSPPISGHHFIRKSHLIPITSQCIESHLPSPSNYTIGKNHNSQTFTSNIYNPNRSFMNIRPNLLTVPQKPSLQHDDLKLAK
ncbi:hypothetical protein Smp_136460 [Schistosoma mansoni]|uniref:hypothetical protein n=1 Tax=Schistosoma mansoni TaxID=6183 RepID=UPI0001A64025|nr:hypothetical protein Smp_136460 [Schistosoma mansoni]|eukprot:XP_018655566.1 hypothetical protein Smp_136460 [Schistosoma mansoni]